MSAVHIAQPGPPEGLVVRETPVPKVAGTSSVLIRVQHAGVNRPDILQRQGAYPPPPGASPLPGLEVAGIVVAVGDYVDSESTAPRVGDEVTALCDGGGYAEFAAVPHGQCLRVPKGLSLREAACLPENCFTVWHNLFQQTNVFGQRLEAGSAVLVHGGTGGIGYTAVQMAKARGLTVFATAGSAAKCKQAIAFGADAAIDYKSQDYVAEVKALGGVDLVLDNVCGEYIDRDLQVLRRGGRLAIIGSQGGPVAPNVNFRHAMRNWLTVGCSTIRPRSSEDKRRIAEELEREVWPLYESGAMQVVIHERFPMHRAPEAHCLMESSKHVGKIVLDIAGE